MGVMPGSDFCASSRPWYAEALKERSLMPPVSVTSQARNLAPAVVDDVDDDDDVDDVVEDPVLPLVGVLLPQAARAIAAMPRAPSVFTAFFMRYLLLFTRQRYL